MDMISPDVFAAAAFNLQAAALVALAGRTTLSNAQVTGLVSLRRH